MRNRKYSVNEDVKVAVLGVVKGYDRRRREIEANNKTARSDAFLKESVDVALEHFRKEVSADQFKILKRLLFKSCIYGKRFNYERERGTLAMERSSFYYNREKFIYNVAQSVGLVGGEK